MSRHQFGWDLPPGVSLHHIPGNRPEDMEDEAFWEELYKQFEHHGVAIPEDQDGEEWFVRAFEICRDLAFDRGYKQGQADEQWAQQEIAYSNEKGGNDGN